MDAAHYGFSRRRDGYVFHPGSYFGTRPGGVLKVAIPRLKGCVDELKKNGDKVILRPFSYVFNRASPGGHVMAM